MDGLDLTSVQAWRRLEGNPAARWDSGLAADPVEGTAWRRITDSAFFSPQIEPEFTIGSDDRIFAIGSCFARHVEGALRALNFRVESLTDAFDDLAVAGSRNTPIGFMNKYNAESILNELRWALEPGAGFPAAALVPLGDGQWDDPHATPVFGGAGREEALRRHRLLTDVIRRVPGCRVVVITLGLVETFFDTVTGLYTNSTPRLDAQRERFRFRVLSYDDVVAALEGIVALLTEFGHPELEIVVTVSPVPLTATFTGQDVVVANAFSKSVLRAAAGHWAAAHANVHYFPSYEIVTSSRRESAWERDGRHVRFELVQHVMELFAAAHVPERERPAAAEMRSAEVGLR